MSKSRKNIKKQLERLKKKAPLYLEILQCYERVFEEQGKITPYLNIVPAEITEATIVKQMKEGSPLMHKEDFILDIPSAVSLFQSICRIMMTANQKMNEHVQIIEKALLTNALEIKELLGRYYDESFIRKVAENIETEKTILTFLIQMSIQPSIRANIEQINGKVKSENWLRGYCPVCGSLPQMAEIKTEGKRYLLCSFCEFEWPGLRLQCPYCENCDHTQLHYFYAEGQEAYRADMCEKCKQYIKTIDSRKLDYEPYPYLEDIVTMHLDIIASEKGFKRPLENTWGL